VRKTCPVSRLYLILLPLLANDISFIASGLSAGITTASLTMGEAFPYLTLKEYEVIGGYADGKMRWTTENRI